MKTLEEEELYHIINLLEINIKASTNKIILSYIQKQEAISYDKKIIKKLNSIIYDKSVCAKSNR